MEEAGHLPRLKTLGDLVLFSSGTCGGRGFQAQGHRREREHWSQDCVVETVLDHWFSDDLNAQSVSGLDGSGSDLMNSVLLALILLSTTERDIDWGQRG